MIPGSTGGPLPPLPPATAQNSTHERDRPAGTPSPRRYRDAGELPAAHAQGRRPPAALALRPSLAAANPSFPLGQLPTELQQQVLPHLDAESLAMLARTSKAMHAMVHGHPPTPGTFRAARFMSTLSAAGAGPLAPDLVELHACVEHFSKDQFQFLVAMALRESEAGFEHTDLLGPLLNKSSRHDAEQIAQALDKMDAPLYAGDAPEQVNRDARGQVLVQALIDMGRPKHGDVYEPLMERLARSDDYAIKPFMLQQLHRHIERMPDAARDRICAALLDRDGGARERQLLAHEMFRLLPHLSSDAQDLVYDKTRDLFQELGPLPDDRAKRRLREILYSERLIGDALPDRPDQRLKWNALIDSTIAA